MVLCVSDDSPDRAVLTLSLPHDGPAIGPAITVLSATEPFLFNRGSLVLLEHPVLALKVR
jgi:hypothetical protein